MTLVAAIPSGEVRYQVWTPSLHPKQSLIRKSDARFIVLSCGRRFGKDTLGHRLVFDQLTQPGSSCAWMAPTYRMMQATFKDLQRLLAPIIVRVSASERTIETVGGSRVEMWTLGNETVRGNKYRLVIINEAALVPGLKAKWVEAIRPTLADYRGRAVIMSTPRGRNDFWHIYQTAVSNRDDGWAAYSYPTWENPHIAREEIDSMRATMTERAFKQEVEAHFLEDGGAVFRRISEAATATRQDAPIEGHRYIIGVDWGKVDDYTAIAVLDETTRELVFMDRFNRIDYGFQRSRLWEVYRRFGGTVIAEENSIGSPIIDELRREGMPVRPYRTTNASKAEAIEALALAIEKGDLRIINDDVLISELFAYQQEHTKSGAPKYGAPEGMHDDCVMSLAIAWSMMGKRANYGFGGAQ
jgi:hypothetical protein